MRLFLSAWVGVALFVIVAAAPACLKGPVSPTVIAPVMLTAQDTFCVLEHYGEPATQIMGECNLAPDAFKLVEDLLAQASKRGLKAGAFRSKVGCVQIGVEIEQDSGVPDDAGVWHYHAKQMPYECP